MYFYSSTSFDASLLTGNAHNILPPIIADIVDNAVNNVKPENVVFFDQNVMTIVLQAPSIKSVQRYMRRLGFEKNEYLLDVFLNDSTESKLLSVLSEKGNIVHQAILM